MGRRLAHLASPLLKEPALSRRPRHRAPSTATAGASGTDATRPSFRSRLERRRSAIVLALSLVCAGLLVAAPMAIFFSTIPGDGGTSTEEPGGVYTGPGDAEGGGSGGAPVPLTTAASRSPGSDGAARGGARGGSGGGSGGTSLGGASDGTGGTAAGSDGGSPSGGTSPGGTSGGTGGTAAGSSGGSPSGGTPGGGTGSGSGGGGGGGGSGGSGSGGGGGGGGTPPPPPPDDGGGCPCENLPPVTVPTLPPPPSLPLPAPLPQVPLGSVSDTVGGLGLGG